MDYTAFANGMLVESGATASWKNRASQLSNQLDSAEMECMARVAQYNGAFDVITMLMEEVRESNPESPLANKDEIRRLLKVMAQKNAVELGYTFDDDHEHIFKLP